jgi:hypothetical protein
MLATPTKRSNKVCRGVGAGSLSAPHEGDQFQKGDRGFGLDFDDFIQLGHLLVIDQDEKPIGLKFVDCGGMLRLPIDFLTFEQFVAIQGLFGRGRFDQAAKLINVLGVIGRSFLKNPDFDQFLDGQTLLGDGQFPEIARAGEGGFVLERDC